MKIKNIMLALVASSSLFTFGLRTPNVSASTWHKGVPSKVKGYWKSKSKYLKGRNDHESNNIHFSSNQINYYAIGHPDTSETRKLSYHYDGKNTYTIKGVGYAQYNYLSGHDYYKVHLYNHNKIKLYLTRSNLKGNVFHMRPNFNRSTKKHVFAGIQ